MTTLTLHQNGRTEYLLTSTTGAPCGVLRTNRGVRRGEALAEHERWELHSHGFGRRRTTARASAGVLAGGPADAGGQPVISLNPPVAVLPGRQTEAHWSLGRNFRRYRGVLVDGAAMVTVLLPAGGHRPAQIEVTGDWPYRNLVVLTACFTLLARRRRDLMIIMAAVIGSGSP